MNRKKYFLCYFSSMLLFVGGITVFAIAMISNSKFQFINSGFLFLLWLPLFIGLVAFAWAGLASTVKRLHDLNLSGWWLVAVTIISVPLNLIDPAICALFDLSVNISLFCVKGTDGPNNYGEDLLLKQQDATEVSSI
jgi:uncharacterized membrane protein YhaH (DUF805 family)